MKFKVKYILLLLGFAFQFAAYAQPENAVTTTIDGKLYYLHSVEKGNTLYSISKLYKADISEIVAANPEIEDGLKEGQQLKIPAKKTEQRQVGEAKPALKPGEKLHKVEKGQTLYAISAKYKMGQEAILARNPGIKSGLKAGQEIVIPKRKGDNTIVAADSIIVQNDTLIMNLDGDSLLSDSVRNDSTVFNAEFKEVYNLSLLLPFYLDVNDSIHRNVKPREEEHVYFRSLVAIEYMQGAMLALDSAEKLGISANMHVFETNNSLKQVKLLAEEQHLKSSDLIIGPLFRTNFELISFFAKANKINIVSPVPQSNKVLLGNEYVSKVYPSSITQMEQMAEYVAKHHAGENIVLIDSKSKEDEAILNAFKSKLNMLLDSVNGKKIEPVQMGYVSSKSITPHIQVGKRNIFVVLSTNEVYVSNMLTKLNGLDRKNEIMVYGTEQWTDFTNTDYKYFNNLNVHIATPDYIDYDTLKTQQYIQLFRNKYGTDPGKYACLGFDVTLYYLMALQKFGTGFKEKLPEFKYEGICTKFNFFKAGLGNGYENRSVYMVHYKDYNLQLVDAQ